MKFGKHLRKARERSNPQWSNYWVDYKMLKRLVKAAAAAGVTGGDAAPPALGALHPARSVGPEGGLTPVRTRSASHLPWDLRGAPASIPEERAFFSAMLQNLSKVSAFYGRSIQRHEAQVATLCDEVAREARSDANGGAVGSERRRGRAASATDLLARCRDVYLDLLMLEQFAVLNYCGFSKILKKHDKCTGRQTREKYMGRMVNPLPFTHYRSLRTLVCRVETLFQRLSRLHPTVSTARPRLASEAEELLEELKVLRGETSNIQIAGPTAPQPGSEAPAASAGATTSAGSDTPKWKDPSVTRTLPERAAGAPLVLASAYDGMAADEALAVEVLASASHRADPPAGAGLGNEGASSDAPLGVALPGVEAVRRQAAAAAPRHGGSTGQPAVRKRPSRSPQPPAKRAR